LSSVQYETGASEISMTRGFDAAGLETHGESKIRYGWNVGAALESQGSVENHISKGLLGR
jgi:hypothetical protein